MIRSLSDDAMRKNATVFEIDGGLMTHFDTAACRAVAYCVFLTCFAPRSGHDETRRDARSSV